MGFFRRGAWLVLIASSATLGACNALTGAEALIIEEDDDSRGDDGAGAGNGSGNGSGNGAGPAGGAGGTTTDPGTTTTTTETPAIMMVDAPGVVITQIALYQSVKAVLMENGSPVNDDVPIVAGRDALMRLWLALDGNYDGQPVTARLHIEGAAAPIESTTAVSGAPKDNALGSTLNFDIPGASIPQGMAFRVELLQPDAGKGPNPGARYPAQGFAQSGALSIGQTLKIVLVPIRYGADGSNRLPDTSPKMVQGYKDLFYAMYPAPQVDITVRNPVQYNSSVSANGSGWENLLGYIGQVRANDNAPFDVYYYGIFEPANSFNGFCSGGCVSGLGNIGGPGDSYARTAIGLGFSDDGGTSAWETAVHEVGHNHGRYHSPCGGAQGVEPGYPYSGGKTGVWGYNLLTKELYNPQNNTDVMGYCWPIWVSDFTYKAFVSRIKSVNGASIVVPEEMKDRTYDRARIDGDGNLHWMPSLKMELPPMIDPIEIDVDTDAGSYTVSAHYYPYDHLPGGVVLWAQVDGPSKAMSLDVGGVKKYLVK